MQPRRGFIDGQRRPQGIADVAQGIAAGSCQKIVRVCRVDRDSPAQVVGFQGDIIEALGATPLSIPPPDVYQAANRKVINGIMTPWTGVIQFKVDEVTNFHLESWIGAATAFLLMNKNVWEKLPQAGKDVFERNSGRVLSKKFGHELDGIALDQRAEIKAKPGHTVVELDAKERERWAQRVAPVYDQWIERTPDGANVLAAFRAEMAKLDQGQGAAK